MGWLVGGGSLPLLAVAAAVDETAILVRSPFLLFLFIWCRERCCTRVARPIWLTEEACEWLDGGNNSMAYAYY